MADKTLYDILEVSSGASPEVIRVAYERLSAKYAPDAGGNAADNKILADAIKEAFLTISNPKLRSQYDKMLEARTRSILQNVEVVEPFWSLPKMIVIALIVAIGGGYYYKHKQTEARLAAEMAIAEAQAKETAEKARAEAEQARLEYQRQQSERMAEQRDRMQSEAAVRGYSAQSQSAMRQAEYAAQREQNAERMKQQQRQRDEAQAANAARAQLQRDRAELCRIERERYGYSSSC